MGGRKRDRAFPFSGRGGDEALKKNIEEERKGPVPSYLRGKGETTQLKNPPSRGEVRSSSGYRSFGEKKEPFEGVPEPEKKERRRSGCFG